MLDAVPGLELSQADAIACALLADSLFEAAAAARLNCRRCGDEIDAPRLAAAPNATWCSRCVTFHAVDRGRRQ